MNVLLLLLFVVSFLVLVINHLLLIFIERQLWKDNTMTSTRKGDGNHGFNMRIDKDCRIFGMATLRYH